MTATNEGAINKAFKHFNDAKNEVYNAAITYIQHGLSVIPLKYKDKKPLIEWKEYQERQPTIDEIEQWLKNGRKNIAVITGSVSGNIVVIDFDDKEKYREFMFSLPRKLYETIGETWIVSTSRGTHVYLRIKDIDAETFKQHFKTMKLKHVDIKAEGGYVVAPPSIHPDGAIYTFLQGPPEYKIVEIDVETFDEILKILGAKPQITSKNVEQTNRETTIRGAKFRRLKEAEKIEIIEALRRVWHEGARHDLAFYIAGWAAWQKIDPRDIIDIILIVAKSAGDRELTNRVNAVIDQYHKLYGDKVIKLISKAIAEHGLPPLKPTGQQTTRVGGRTLLKEKTLDKLVEEGKITAEDAEALIDILEEIFCITPPGLSFSVCYDYEKQRYFINDLKRCAIFEAKRKDSKKEYLSKIIDAAIEELKIIEDTIVEERVFKATFKEKNSKFEVEAFGFKELYKQIEERGLILNDKKARNALTHLINAMKNYNRAEIAVKPSRRGFFIIDGKIIANEIDTKYDTNKLREAVIFLNEIIEKWFNKSKEQAATVIKWFLAAPFSYCLKQLKKGYIQAIYLYGPSTTGKTTLCRVGASIWDAEKYFTNGNSVSTPSRLADAISETTLPITINEAEKIIKEDSKVVDLLKDIIEEKYGRSRSKRDGRGKERFPAFATMAMTSNTDFPKLDAFGRRFIVVNFSWSQRFTKDPISKFEKEVKPRLNILTEIGKFIAKKVIEDNSIVTDVKTTESWKEIASKIIRELEKETGITISWKDFEYGYALEEDIEHTIIEKIREEIFRELETVAIKHNLAWPPRSKYDYDIIETISQHIPWLFVKNDDVIITKRKFFDEVGGFKGFEEMTGGKAKATQRRIGQERPRCISMNIADFIEFLMPNVEEDEDDKNDNENADEQEGKIEQREIMFFDSNKIEDNETRNELSDLLRERLSVRRKPFIFEEKTEQIEDTVDKTTHQRLDKEGREESQKHEEVKEEKKKLEKTVEDIVKELEKRRKEHHTENIGNRKIDKILKNVPLSLRRIFIRRLVRGRYTKEYVDSVKRRSRYDSPNGVHRAELRAIETLISGGYAKWDKIDEKELLVPTTLLSDVIKELGLEKYIKAQRRGGE